MIKESISKFLKDSFTPPPQLPDNKGVSQRIVYIDLIKGICIILVILSHFDKEIFNFPNSDALRMPLYFLLSGLFFKTYNGFQSFFIKKVNNLIVPFLFWLLIAYLLVSIGRLMITKETYDISNLFKWFFTHEIDFNIAIWFLVCLFITNLIFYLLRSYIPSHLLLTSVLIFALLGNILGSVGFMLPLWADTACTALPFFYLGYYLKNSDFLLPSPRQNNLSLLIKGLLLIGISYLCYFFFEKPYIWMEMNRVYGNPVIAYLNSTCYVLGLLLICKVINWLPIVSYFGRFSIIVLCTQMPIMGNVDDLTAIVLGHHLSWGGKLALTLLFCWLAIPICKLIIPYFVAQKQLISTPIKKPTSAISVSDH